MHSFHVREFLKNPPSNAALSDTTDMWAETTLNENFFYGQDDKDSPKFRWIVYHPEDRTPAQVRIPDIHR